MTAFTPADQAARDAIRERVDVNMCVEAGAGTGKTSVLVDRIVHLLRSGWAQVHEIAVVTFTEKAAAELAARVRQGLDDALDAPADAAEQARLEAAVRGLNQAHIETIHAFAASLLRERPVEAALDPAFRVMDDLPSQLAFESAFDDWFAEEAAGDTPPTALLDAIDLGMEVRLVREAALLLNRHRDLLPLAPWPHQPVDPLATLDAAAAALADVAALAPRPGIEDAAHAARLEIGALVDGLQLLRDRPAALRRAIATEELPPWSRGNQKHWSDRDHCRRVKHALEEVKAQLGAATSAMRANATAALVAWLQGFVHAYAARRRAEGTADFEDLLIWARDLVRDHPHVRRYFQAKYRCILVDEFQDTDPLQAELIVYLCEDGTGPGDWRQARLRAGSLFVVGDPKQSVYRFRRADLGMYDAVRERIFGGQTAEIAQNFRSRASIVAWVNRTFAPLFREEPGVHPRYIGLRAAPGTDAAGVLLVRGSVPGHADRSGFVEEQRLKEAAALASLLRREVEAGGWPVRDGDAVRSARYRDIAMLVPNRTALAVYEDALARAGVPHRHEGGRNFFQRQEVRELIALLRAADDPSDAIAAVAALRSAAFGCSDEDLLRYRASGARFHHQRVGGDAPEPVASALRTLHAWAERRHDTPLPDLVRAVLDEARLVEYAMLQPQGEQPAANLLKLIDQARAFADAGGGLRGFVRWLKEHTERAADETDASISEESDDVLRILTMHASKGLEFPVVVLANLAGARVARTAVVADRAGSGRLHMKLGSRQAGFATPDFAHGADMELVHRMAEERRLLYVAATRARDLLVLPLVTTEDQRRRLRGPEDTRSLLDWLLLAGAADGGDGVAVVDAAELPPLTAETPVWRRSPAAAVDGAAAQGVIAARAAWEAGRRGLIARAATPALVATATALKPEWEPPAGAPGDVRRGRAADFGSAVHAALERIDLRRPDDAPGLADAVAAEFGMPARAREVERLVRATLASAVIARALRSPRILRETPFTVALPGAARAGVAEGRMDLLFEEDGALVVVDFKTDDVAAGAIAGRAEHYRNQALVYAWAARAATAMPVRDVIFLFARSGVEHPIVADAAFFTEAEALLRDPARAALDATG